MTIQELVTRRDELLADMEKFDEIPTNLRDDLFALEDEISEIKPGSDQDATALLGLAKQMVEISGEDNEKSIIANVLDFMGNKTKVRKLENGTLLSIYETAEQAAAYFPENAMQVTIDYQDDDTGMVECLQIGNKYSRLVIAENGLCSLLIYEGKSDEPDMVLPTSLSAFESAMYNPIQMVGLLSGLTRTPIAGQ